MRLQMMIDELSNRADESDLVALLATSRQKQNPSTHGGGARNRNCLERQRTIDP